MASWKVSEEDRMNGPIMTTLRQILGLPLQYGGVEHSGWLPNVAVKPPLTPQKNFTFDFTISAYGHGYLFEWSSREKDEEFEEWHALSGDTWHETLEEALRQAEYSFGLRITDWSEVG
jgi:hypothetical protein